MARLYRPHIPLSVRLTVVLRQLEFIPAIVKSAVNAAIKDRRVGEMLHERLGQLAMNLGCERKDLRLDHDPPLAARPSYRRGLGKKRYYIPAANDPDHLVYRPHGAEFEGSHLIKTLVRGDHGQFPDRVLIKRERKRHEKKKPKPKMKIRSRGFDKTRTKGFDGKVRKR